MLHSPRVASPSLAVLLFLIHSLQVFAEPPARIGFNDQIRPILSNTCFYCHGPDEKHREADLRLDTAEGAMADLGGYAAIVPGHPEKSALVERITTHDKDEAMPPSKSKKARLSEEQIALLTKWIEQGADYQGHWSFMPLSKEAVPEVKLASWPKNPIDQFILSRLEKAGIPPSMEAGRATLIRRVSLDLIGLLPSPEEIDAFMTDPLPDAYERLVDRLLANPHYGERWGRHWLDQARYADSNGYTVDSDRMMWPYRDWVIKSLNDDVPFDRFTIEQLAGDLLPKPSKSQLVATAFHRNTLINEEGGVKPEQFRVEAVIDRVNTTGAVWLGLTVGCAQCHSHKFDPISHREYYEMFAFFNQGEDINNKGATIEIVRGEIFGQPIAAEPAKLPRTEINEGTPVRKPPNETTVWTPAQYLEFDTSTGAGFRLLEDNSLLSDGRGASNDVYRIVAKTGLKQISAIRLRVLTDDSLPHRGPGMASNGNFVLTGFDISVGGEEQPIATAFADHEQANYPISGVLDDNPKTGWAINTGKESKVKMNAPHEALFILSKPIVVSDKPIEIRLHHDLNQSYLVGRFAIDFSPEESGVPEGLPKPPKVQRENDATSDIAQLMVMKEVEKPRETFLFQRGDFLRPDEKLGPLNPGVIGAVNAAFSTKPARFGNRLDLARWLVSPENPLTPRVTMNRLWMRYFGRGIVETDEDFGSQGSAPTHPELLDWLGSEFIRREWSLKAMHRLIVTSATYRQSSAARPELLEKDPRNLLLARQERVRVEAEIIRDTALSASGLLDERIGGPSVRPPQPDGVYSFTQTARKWTASLGPDRYRRALYTAFYRSAPYPLFTTFDSPDFQSVCTRRARSNTPLQALTLANDQAFFEIAQGLAARLLKELPGESDLISEARLKRALVLCFCRMPSEKELAIVRGYYDGQVAALQNDMAAASALMNKELAASGTPPPVAAALVCAARAILNADAFITRE
ncbi:MAG: Planctomycete cytochrome [Chthoniobacteraceae bacterium]|nr:Planctomycete cytochrome [Chthoniobacteraceae bacterium]